MRIITISWEYPPHVVGGLGRHVAELSPALAQQGLQVEVVTPTTEHREATIVEKDGLRVHYVPVAKNENSANIHTYALTVNERLAGYIRGLNYGAEESCLLHVHDWLTSFAGLTLQAELGWPLVVTIHATERGRVRGYVSNLLQRAIERAEHAVIKQAREVIVCSRYMSRELQKFFRALPEKLHVIPNGVDVEQLSCHVQPEELQTFRSQYAQSEEPLIFTVGRLVYEKGIHLLIESVPEILKVHPHAQIIVAGKGPEVENLQQQAEILGVADNVHLIGFVTDETRNCLFQVASCAVFPSLYEPFGIVALEAMALGCPVLVSDVGGLSEVVTHEETGITSYANDPHSIVWGVVHILDHPDKVQGYTENAHQSVASTFNWSRIAQMTTAVYQQVLDQ